MRTLPFLAASLLLLSYSSADTTTNPCPILGPPFPKPRHLASSKTFKDSLAAFDRAVDQGLRNGSTEKFGNVPFKDSTFSVGVFGIYDEGLLHEYHYTAPEVSNSTSGVKEADADSIYRIGSISKLLTVYIFLIREGFTRFEDPVTKYIPELELPNLSSPYGRLGNWSEVTVGDIASQLSGAARDLALNDVPIFPGAPDLNPSQIPECDRFDPTTSIYQECKIQQYIQGISQLPALFPPGHTPTYNNAAFAFLGLILERISGKPFPLLFQEHLIHPLSLTSTSYSVPNSTTHAIIPTNDTLSRWSTNLDALNPSGNVYSSTNDLALLGKSILNATLLSPALTNRWLKPHSFTSDFRPTGGNLGVGMPWEIYIVVRNDAPTEFYAKGGDWGAYHTFIVLVPDYGVGFTVLAASTKVAGVREAIVGLLSDLVLPAIAVAAREEAEGRFAGSYTYTAHADAEGGAELNGSSSVAFSTDEVDSADNFTTYHETLPLNSTLTLTITTDNHPGLRVTTFISNGTDQLEAYAALMTGGSDDLETKQYVDLRLFPNELFENEEGDGGGKVGFIGVWNLLPRQRDLFWSGCVSWLRVGTVSWGGFGVGDFMFDFDYDDGDGGDDGRAVGVWPKGYGVKLRRVDGG